MLKLFAALPARHQPAADHIRHEFVTAFSEYAFSLRIHPDRINFARWLTPGRNLLVSTDVHGWHTVKFQMESDQLAQMLVFGLDAACEVIEPLSLKEAVARACQELLKQL